MDRLQVLDSYRQSARLLHLERGWICKDKYNDITFQTVWSHLEPSSESKLYVQKCSTSKNRFPSVPTCKPGLIEFCGTGEARALRAHLSTQDDDSKSFLDLWNNDILIKRYDLGCKELHGHAYTNSEFSSLSFSPDGTKLMYLAEKKQPKSCSFFNQNIKDECTPGHVFDFNDSWGEQLSKCCNSAICIIDIETGSVSVLDTPENIFCAKPVWSSDDSICFIGMEMSPFKLGAIYCSNRESRLYSYNLETKIAEALTPPGNTVLSPAPATDGHVVFLYCPAGGPHRTYTNVCIFWPDSSHSQKPSDNAETVPGGYVSAVPDSLFCGKLSRAPWIDNDHVLLVVLEGWKTSIVKLNISDGSKEYPLINSLVEHQFSFDVVDQIGTEVMFSFSHMNSFAKSYRQGIGYFNMNDPNNVTFIVGTDESDEECTYCPMSFSRDGRDYNGILIHPNNGKNLSTLIVYPHGGPHSAFTTAFSPNVHVLYGLGYSILLVNYTGSLGLGVDSISTLSGNVGDMDVKDVHEAAVKVSTSHGYKHVVVLGGSHGGFLAAHLIGQYPDFYKAAAMRNPVIDISTMVGSSDIPDWSYYEAGLEYDAKHPPVPTPEHVTTMLRKSPIRYVDSVKCPVLLLIGAKDQRVPPSQGIRYYQYLKSRGVTCDLKHYPDDSHPLSSVACSADCMVHIHLWFKTHLNI